MIRTNVSLSEDLYKRAKNYGFKNNLSFSSVIRISLESFLNPIPQLEELGVQKKIPDPKSILGLKIPLTKEMKEKILNPRPKTFIRKRGEMNADDYV